MAQVVEDQQAVRKHEHRVGELLVVLGEGRKTLDVADHVVGQEPDRAALETGQARHGDCLELGQQAPKGLEWIAARQQLRGPVGPSHADPTALGGEHQVRVGAQERVAGPLLAAFDRLEEEGVGAGPEPQEGGQRGVEVRGELGEDRDQVALCRQGVKLLTRR